MRRPVLTIVLAPALLAGCAAQREPATRGTLAELRAVEPDVEEARVEHGLDQAMEGYRRFLEETPETSMTPEAMRRLADLQIEKEFGIHTGDGTPRELAAPDTAGSVGDAPDASADPAAPVVEANAVLRESDGDFERRTTTERSFFASYDADAPMPAGAGADVSGPLEAIALYDRLLDEYPNYEHRDQVLYQKARAYDELGRTEEAMATMEQLIRGNTYSDHYDEVQFRRGEYFFTRRKFRDAENAYGEILRLGPSSTYYELALYKLGWTLYKQEFYEQALHRYAALLDHKLSIGYDFDAAHEEDDERRVTDTFRVISLSFSNLGGPEAVEEYFTEFGHRSYEDRVYDNLGKHYLHKLRYDDAAKTYRTFVAQYPFHRAAPRFGMRVIETFTAGEFPRLVLEAKREFATSYGLHSDYWRHYAPEDSPEVLAYLKDNLDDLATHYHAEYQNLQDAGLKLASFGEARRWYGDYLASFPEDPDTPAVNYRLADLLLEHEDFGEAARAYERTAYDYPTHERSAAAGYAAVYAHREDLKAADDARADAVRSETVASSLRFADTFPLHEHAAAVLGAAADDQYAMQDYPAAVESARRVLENYPVADPPIRRSAWIVVAHGSFDLAEYAGAEVAYNRVLAATPEDDASYAGFVDNLAASIYKQGELAGEAGDHRAAADHFLRIRSTAPTSTIRATAEYDAGVALAALEAWDESAEVLEAFRETYPGHELESEATRLIAHAYREGGDLSRAAREYDRIATETDDPTVRGDALLLAGDLYEQSNAPQRAIDTYRRYVDEFPRPVEIALETRLKIAGIHEASFEDGLYREELAEIVRIDAEAGPERTARTRTIAARSALTLAEDLHREFVAVRLLQPFEDSLHEKQQRMDTTIAAMNRLVSYEIADVTAAATYYIAETYLDFSRSLAESERPTDLAPAEMSEYELVLEEEAFPFEEKAIDFHEENLEMVHAGFYNDWTGKSLDRLATLVPGRYAKNELSTGLAGTIDRFVYRSPAPPIYGPMPLDDDRIEHAELRAPAAGSDDEVDHATSR